MIKHLAALFIVAILFSTTVQAQDKKEIKNLEYEYKANMKADEFQEAIKHLTVLLKSSPDNAEYNYNAGKAYYSLNQKAKALPYLEKVASQAAKYPDIDYLLGKCSHAAYKFDNAIAAYDRYFNTLVAQKGDNKKKIEEIVAEKKICENAKVMQANPVNVRIENLGKMVNSVYPDYAPVISADETVLIFTSRRYGTSGGKKAEEDGLFYEDIYICYKNDTTWTEPMQISTKVNTQDHDAGVALSADGQKMIVYKSDKESKILSGDLYLSDLVGGEWTEPKPLGDNINTKYWEPSASITADDKIIYFSSDKPGGFGGRDIYMSKMLPNGTWGVATNLGADINTPADEDAPFIHPDGKTLYFSSTGHTTMGGFDIFTSVLNDNTRKWSQPQNMGYPINTTEDDIYFVWSADGTRAYFASAREDGMGDKDIYVLHRPDVVVPLIVLKGKIFSDKTKNPLNSTITVTDNTTKEVVSISNSNALTGKYTVVLTPGKNYNISVESEGYLFHSENFDIPNLKEFEEINKDIFLQQVTVGSKIVLRNIFFDFDKATLRPESEVELALVKELMEKYPNILVEISGHTDSLGNAVYNQYLSETRANSVVDYLIAKGIDKNRLSPIGYGENQPIADNGTDEGRQLNRRTEFTLVESIKPKEVVKPKDNKPKKK